MEYFVHRVPVHTQRNGNIVLLNYPWKVSGIVREHGFEYILASNWVEEVRKEFQKLLGEKFSK
jgi:hypothetical protein